MSTAKDVIRQDFLLALSVIFLCAIFNKTILRVLSDLEMFSDGTSVADWKTYFTSKYFFFPNLYSILTIIWFFAWIGMYVFKKK